MASLIHELENNEALLMMYLSGELPPEDRIEVEQMLSGDAGLRGELAEIQLAMDGAMGVLAKLDADRSAIPAENHAIRQAMRAMKQWQVDRLARQPVLIVQPRRQMPIWAYSLGSVAALLIGTIAWWGFGGNFHSISTSPTIGSSAGSSVASSVDSSGTATIPPSVPSGAPDASTEGPVATVSAPSPEVAEVPAPAAAPQDATADRLDDSLSGDAPVEDSSSGFTDAESQASTLVARSDNASVTSEIFLTETNP